jgi:hypothetical protein
VRVLVIPLLGACLSLAACGGEGGDGDGPTREETGPTRDSRAVESLAERYFAALATGHTRAACATRARRDRLALARTAGSCQRAFKAIIATRDFEPLQNARIGTVTVRGRRASVRVIVPGDDGAARLLAIKEGRRWGLISEETLNEDRAEEEGRSRPRRAQGPPCPPGTPLVRAGDLVAGLPSAYELVGAAEEPLVDVLRVALRGRLRRVETKVLLRRGSEIGTSLTIVNSRERLSEEGFLTDTLVGAKAGGARRHKRVDIAGRRGVLVTTSEGGFAAAQIGPCASVLLVDDDRARLLRAASLLSIP